MIHTIYIYCNKSVLHYYTFMGVVTVRFVTYGYIIFYYNDGSQHKLKWWYYT